MGSNPEERHVRIGELDLACFEWPGAEPAVLLVHATGFHARCWQGVARELEGVRLLAPDLRGHGRSSKLPPYRWDVFGRDLELLCELLEVEQWVGVGHSLGGHAVVQAAAARPESFRALVLVDPVILAPEAYASLARADRSEPHPTARRQNDFASPEAMYERFANRPPYSVFEPEVLRAYCEHGLLPTDDGRYRLACPPEVESQIYGGTGACDVHSAIGQIQVPVDVLRARPRSEGATFDFSSSPTWPELAARFPRGTDSPYPEFTHFLPMQVPGIVARHIRAARAGEEVAAPTRDGGV